MLYKKDGEIYVPQYVIDDKGIKLAYSISDNKDNKSEYRLIQIPEWEGSKETPDERKEKPRGL